MAEAVLVNEGVLFGQVLSRLQGLILIALVLLSLVKLRIMWVPLGSVEEKNEGSMVAS
jgi:hypothetical protein